MQLNGASSYGPHRHTLTHMQKRSRTCVGEQGIRAHILGCFWFIALHTLDIFCAAAFFFISARNIQEMLKWQQ